MLVTFCKGAVELSSTLLSGRALLRWLSGVEAYFAEET